GGVDLSIDPFEIIGFAKTGALAKGEMKVYDRGSNGFWPGEGCGMIVLMRDAEARAAGHRVYASIAGWGISSDGKGGITRPEDSGALRVLSKAEPWPDGAAVRAAVTAMGFGGINTHVVLEGTAPRRRTSLDSRTGMLASSRQDAELLLVDAASTDELRDRLT